LAKSGRLFIGIAEQRVEHLQQSDPAHEGRGLIRPVAGAAADLVPVEADVDRDVPGLDAHGQSIGSRHPRHIVATP